MKSNYKINISVLLSIIFTFSQSVMAKENTDFVGLEGFVDGCTELVHIFVKRDQKRMLAGQTTSLSEALRAGYCRGVIEQYKHQNDSYNYGCQADWYEIAEFVARQNGVEQKFGDMESLIETACHGG